MIDLEISEIVESRETIEVGRITIKNSQEMCLSIEDLLRTLEKLVKDTKEVIIEKLNGGIQNSRK